MKKSNLKKILFIFLLFICFSFKQNGKNEGLTNVKIYMIEWNAKYKLARTVKNIKQNYLYSFESEHTDLKEMFSDYDDCILKLQSQDTLSENNSITCSIGVELFYGNKKVKIYFKNSGDYYYNGKWYKINYGLYSQLFSFFSEELVPPTTLEKAKLNTKDFFWHNN